VSAYFPRARRDAGGRAARWFAASMKLSKPNRFVVLQRIIMTRYGSDAGERTNLK
jgi:hypothetical protein